MCVAQMTVMALVEVQGGDRSGVCRAGGTRQLELEAGPCVS